MKEHYTEPHIASDVDGFAFESRQLINANNFENKFENLPS
jgi:hypothetical protein